MQRTDFEIFKTSHLYGSTKKTCNPKKPGEKKFRAYSADSCPKQTFPHPGLTEVAARPPQNAGSQNFALW